MVQAGQSKRLGYKKLSGKSELGCSAPKRAIFAILLVKLELLFASNDRNNGLVFEHNATIHYFKEALIYS